MKIKTHIRKLEKQLKEHPLFDNVTCQIQPGADKTLFKAFKDKYGFEPDERLAEFYVEMNGFTLAYTLKDNSKKTLQAFTRSPYSPDINPVGSINFLSFEKTFLADSWSNILYETNSMTDADEFIFNNDTFTYDSFGKKLKPFDLYSEETCAAFILTDKNRFDVILLEDHYADWKNSRMVDFDTYVTFILLTGGLVEAREFFLSEIDGDTMPKITIHDATPLIPNFFGEIFNDLLDK